MNLSEKKRYIEKINEILEPIESNSDLFEVLGELLIDYDLRFLGNLTKEGYEPLITSEWLEEECCYTEGCENAGHVTIGRLLEFIEEILNTADTERCITFKDYFMRLETEEELEENERPKDVVWYTKGENLDFKKLVAFEVDY